jgi:hypothetical protein
VSLLSPLGGSVLAQVHSTLTGSSGWAHRAGPDGCPMNAPNGSSIGKDAGRRRLAVATGTMVVLSLGGTVGIAAVAHAEHSDSAGSTSTTGTTDTTGTTGTTGSDSSSDNNSSTNLGSSSSSDSGAATSGGS